MATYKVRHRGDKGFDPPVSVRISLCVSSVCSLSVSSFFQSYDSVGFLLSFGCVWFGGGCVGGSGDLFF